MPALPLPHGSLRTPAFLPDATRGAVRALDPADLRDVGVQGVVMNLFHLLRTPGPSVVEALGGLHAFTGWSGPLVTDSGGFQAWSLTRGDRGAGRISRKGFTVRLPGDSAKTHLTPEKSVRLQAAMGADAVFCLDDCTHPDDPPDRQKEAVDRTLDWARRGRDTFARFLEQKSPPPDRRPRLFAVIQGGADLDLRRRCAEGLLALGFDGYGYGGWPLDRNGRLLAPLFEAVRGLVPSGTPLFALGVGHPVHIRTCVRMGYDLFDSALPTRDARRGRIWVRPGRPPGDGEAPWAHLYVADDKHRRDGRPLDSACEGPCCRRHSRAFFHHLFRTGDPLYARLATAHNLRFLMRWMESLRAECDASPPPGRAADGMSAGHR